ncbi:MAG: hypothetical protein D4R73_01530 [Deltaproteobacteria bacterium]|nr:MAG: hypothetical protein D4R73_01530 [Deltaproteobacteria bacterium]
MALTKDRATAYREGIEIEYPVAAVKIYAGSMVCINAAGYAAPAADTVNFKFVGVALEQVDNSTGQAGDKTIRVRRSGVFEFKASSIAQSDVGKQMYVVNDETFDESNPGQGILCGILTKFISATRGWLDIGSGVKPTLAAASADALTVSDGGDFFPAATDTVPEQIQALAGDLIPITIPRYTGWVKDGTDKQLVGPKVELNYPCRIKRGYANLGTAPGADKTLLIKFGADTMITIAGTDTQGEGESLDIAVAANADLLSAAGGVLLNETAAGAAANLDLVLMVARDDGV